MTKIPESVLEEARDELLETALGELNENTVADAIVDEDLLRLIVVNSRGVDLQALRVGLAVLKTVHRFISPSDKEVRRKAAEILADLDYQNGKRK